MCASCEFPYTTIDYWMIKADVSKQLLLMYGEGMFHWEKIKAILWQDAVTNGIILIKVILLSSVSGFFTTAWSFEHSQIITTKFSRNEPSISVSQLSHIFKFYPLSQNCKLYHKINFHWTVLLTIFTTFPPFIVRVQIIDLLFLSQNTLNILENYSKIIAVYSQGTNSHTRIINKTSLFLKYCTVKIIQSHTIYVNNKFLLS